MPRGEPPTALVLGAVTRDETLEPAGNRLVAPGGVVTYAGTALARLGARARVVTRLHERDRDALVGPLRAEGVDVHALDSRHTTTYSLDYSGDSDMHELLATSDPITADDVPPEWRTADLVQLGPLHRRDLLPEAVAPLSGFTGLDVQGLVREPKGTDDLPKLLGHVDVMQVSEEELGALLEGESLEGFAARFGLAEVLVTRGARGASLITPDARHEVPAPRSSGRHRVGAGDVFLACYLLQRVRGSEPRAAAIFAARACAEKVDSGQVPKGFE